MDFDFDFMNKTPTEPPSKPPEAQERAKGANYTAEPQSISQSVTEAYRGKSEELLATAREIIIRDRLKREITEGIMLQLEKDLSEHKNNLPKLLMYLAEALDRSSGGGDQYILRVEKSLKDNGYI